MDKLKISKTPDVSASSDAELVVVASSGAAFGSGASSDAVFIAPPQHRGTRSRSPSVASSASGSRGRFFQTGNASESGSESDTLTETSECSFSVRSEYLKAKKRPAEDEESGGSQEGNSQSRKKGKAKRGRGRPATTGEYVGRAEAQRKLNAEKRQAMELQLEQELLAKEEEARKARMRSGFRSSLLPNFSSKSLDDLRQIVEDEYGGICVMASKCNHIKGTFQRGFKDKALTLKSAFDEAVRRTVTEETEALQADNQRLQAELDSLKQEMTALKAALKARNPPPHTSSPMEVAQPEMARSHSPATTSSGGVPDFETILKKHLHRHSLEERAFVRSALAGIEDRLLPEKRVRPPLAADRAREPVVVLERLKEPFKVPEVPKPQRTKKTPKGSASAAPVPTKLATTPRPTKPAGPAVPETPEDPMLPASTPANENWSTVVKRKRKKGKIPAAASPPSMSTTPGPPKSAGSKKGSKPQAATSSPLAATKAQKKDATKKKKLVPPKTSAVVITLTPEALQKGETYETVLRKARASIDPVQLGIGPARCRQTQTGARKFEFPGASSSTQADTFAAKLREALADSAKVTRPQKTVGLLFSELDDSISKEEVVEKVASVGGCSQEDLRASTIRIGRGGVGTITVQCPVTAATKILDGGRFLIGFSSASVRALEEPPLRCYRCFALGHTRALCPSPVERAELCYRCGKPGHKAASCSAKTHCAVCAASGKPAGHIMGGKNCTPPTKKGKVRASIPSLTAAVPTAMEVTENDG